MSIKKHITQREVLLLQARVNKDLLLNLRCKLKKERLTIRQFIEASIKQFLEE